MTIQQSPISDTVMKSTPVLPGIAEFENYSSLPKKPEAAPPSRRKKTGGQEAEAIPQTKLSDEFEKSLDMLFKTLFKASLFGSVRKMSAEEKVTAKNTLSIINHQVKGFYFPPQPDTVIFYYDKANLEVTQKSITFYQGTQDAPNADGFTLNAAKTMALLASQNRKMLESGVRLTGTEEQQKILRKAILEVNDFLPEGAKLRIIDAKEQVPQQRFTNKPASSSATQSDVEPAETVSAKSGKGWLLRTAEKYFLVKRPVTKVAHRDEIPKAGESVDKPVAGLRARLAAKAAVAGPNPV